jgi:hypothetical protein
LPWLLLVIGALGLLLPWLLAPVSSDERYHYPAAPARMDDNVLRVIPWTINDMEWRMRAGRIAPIGVAFQHASYLLGMQFAFSTGIPVFVVHGLLKALLVVIVVGSFAILLTQLRRRDGESLDRVARRTAVTVFAVLLVLGVTATSPHRNGWITFVVLCIGGIALMFLAGAASLWALRGWQRWGLLGRGLSALGLVVLGVTVMLSYELHWAAVPFAVALLTFVGRAHWQHRLSLVLALTAGWLGTVVWTRQIIAAAATDVYAGLRPDLSGPVIKAIGLQVVNAVPGSGIPYTLYGVGDGLPTPPPFDGTGWLWGALFAAGLVLLLWRAPLTGADKVGEDRQPLVALAAALATSALAAAVILSISEQAHQIVSFVGATYRGTPWIWACLAGIIVVALLVLPGSDWSRRVLTLAVTATAAVLVGVLVWPTTVSAISTQRATNSYVIFERAQAELVTGSADPVAVENRCRIAEQASAWAGDNLYRQGFLPIFERSFKHQWGRPWCT